MSNNTQFGQQYLTFEWKIKPSLISEGQKHNLQRIKAAKFDW